MTSQITRDIQDKANVIAILLQSALRRAAPKKTRKFARSISVKTIATGNGIELIVQADKIWEVIEFGCFFGKGHRIKILTKRGYKSLKNVNIGDLVLTHKNRWRKVLSKPIYKVGKKILRYSIKLKSGSKITVTQEHPFLTKRGWIKAKNLKKSDIIMEIR